jgi:hypothetical protein
VGNSGYNPQQPGMDEARLDAYVALIQGNLTTLNLALSRDELTPIAIVTSNMVELGDTDLVWDRKGTVGGDIRIRVTDDPSGSDGMRIEGIFNRNLNTGWSYDFITHIWIYLHPEALDNLDPVLQASARQRTLSRINDWIMTGVFNFWDPVGGVGGALIPIASNIMTPTGGTPATDALMDNMVSESSKPWVMKGMGKSVWMPSIHLVVTANIE